MILEQRDKEEGRPIRYINDQNMKDLKTGTMGLTLDQVHIFKKKPELYAESYPVSAFVLFKSFNDRKRAINAF